MTRVEACAILRAMTLQSTLSGTWYPGSERGIRAVADAWEKSAPPDASPSAPRPNILLLPHAGWAYSGETAWKAVRLVRGSKFRRAVILAPSHRAWIENRLVAPDAESVSTPLGAIPVDATGSTASPSSRQSCATTISISPSTPRR